MALNDRQLSPHFSLFALTRTDHADLQAENRNVNREEELKLGEMANLLEAARAILGCDLDIHSGRRCAALNKRVGSGPKSQHLKCEAVDFSPAGPDSEESVTAAWQKIVTAARAQRAPGYTGTGVFKFGQLLLEGASAGREGKRVWWIHLSLGAPWRDKARCGEVATLIDGKFVLIAKLA